MSPPSPPPSTSSKSMNSSDLSNIHQGDDSLKQNNSNSKNGINSPTSEHMDSRNVGDHDAHGRFNPFGGLPSSIPGRGNFTRQLGPLQGGKHVDEDENNISTFVDPYVNNAADILSHPPKLGEKRDDEPDSDKIGLDPSQGKMKID